MLRILPLWEALCDSMGSEASDGMTELYFCGSRWLP